MSLETLGLENISQVSPYIAEDSQNHNGRKALPPTLSVLKRSRAIFRPARWKVRVRKVFLCPFHCKTRPSGVSLDSPELENIPLFAGNRAEVIQNHDARKAVSATLSVLKWSGAIFRPRSSKVSVQKVLLCPFNRKLRQSEVSLASPGVEIVRQLPGNRAEVGQNHDARKAVSTTLSVLKWIGGIFRPRSSKLSV